MNYKMVFYILGRVFGATGALMSIPLVCAIIYKESVVPFIIPMAICLLLGILLTHRMPKKKDLLARESFVCVGLSWILMSLVGCLPFIISGAIPSFIDAFFETVSGFSTTGASVVSDVEALGKGILLWRALTHWIGGMGVLVFLLAILPLSDLKNIRFMQVMKAEVPGPTVDKVVPKIADTARVLYGIYILLTFVEFVFLLFGDMNFYEALNHSLATAGTGGFGIKNDSMAGYSPYSQYVVAVFMLLFGTNFNVFFLILTGHFFRAFKSEELWWYFGIVASSVTIIALTISSITTSGEESFRYALFQVAAIISTTGFSTADFAVWPVLSQAIIVLLMFSGACAGCTCGGIKISRILLLAKNAKREIKYILHPRMVKSVKLEGKTVDHETIRGTTSFIIIYAGLLIISALAVIAIEGCDLVTGFTSVVSAINNIGPGLSKVGPTANFSGFSVASKLILCFDMLAGRLELFSILILFSPSTWKKSF